jgi:hypothetical protein
MAEVRLLVVLAAVLFVLAVKHRGSQMVFGAVSGWGNPNTEIIKIHGVFSISVIT